MFIVGIIWLLFLGWMFWSLFKIFFIEVPAQVGPVDPKLYDITLERGVNNYLFEKRVRKSDGEVSYRLLSITPPVPGAPDVWCTIGKRGKMGPLKQVTNSTTSFSI